MKKKSIVITGSDGFLGKNLVFNLINQKKFNVFKINRKTTYKDLSNYILNSEILVHLAAVNRAKKLNDFFVNNSTYTKKICEIIKKNKKKIKIIYSSSYLIKKKSPYGISKKLSEKHLIELKKHGCKVFVSRLPNIFGKWSKPNYNSVVSTFCHNISRNKKIKILNKNRNFNLVYVDDVVKSIVDIILEKKIPKKIFFSIFPRYKTTPLKLAQLIKTFKKMTDNNYIPNLSNDFEKKIYSTYISFLSSKKFLLKLKNHKDKRGDYVEFIKSFQAGQISFFSVNPGQIRGKHFHHSKFEKFYVVDGKAKFVAKNIITQEKREFILDEDNHSYLTSLPGWSHYIENIGKKKLKVILWSNEIYNLKKPDTFYYE